MLRQTTRILLVQDEMTSLPMAAQLLRREGYICDCASDVREATAALAAQPYDLMVADFDIPANQALELICASQRNGHSVPVIVLTGSPCVVTAVQSLHLAVVVVYLIKPVDVTALLYCVGPAVETGRFYQSTLQADKEMQARVGNVMASEKCQGIPNRKQIMAECAWTLERYLEQTVHHLTQIAWSLKGTLDAVKHGCSLWTLNICTLSNCPRLMAYEESLAETITALQKTGNAFKSGNFRELSKNL